MVTPPVRAPATRAGSSADPRILLAVCLLCVLGVIAWTVSSAGQTPSAAGAQLTSSSAGHQQMLALLRQIAEEAPDTHFFIGDGPAMRAREALAALPARAPGPQRWLLQVQVAEEELRLGNEAEATRHFTEARQLVRKSRKAFAKRAVGE